LTSNSSLCFLQDEDPSVRLALVRLLYRLALAPGTQNALIQSGSVSALVSCLSETECQFHQGVIGKAAVNALAILTQAERVCQSIEATVLQRLVQLAKSWHGQSQAVNRLLR
jgi:hypothetical protein